ncbi:M23 family metallopeptidase [Hellea balneolensis]|uniref:M23 family metallopeptidase n=1 Tax=Hellea balneolensis TaxID=287478 RepID=UPI000423C1ED|nr:M23 family metallopeptidase [Hellea balneolensis]
MRCLARLALAFAICGSACAQEKTGGQNDVIKVAQLPNALQSPRRTTKSASDIKPKQSESQEYELDTSMLGSSPLNHRKHEIDNISCHGIPKQGGAVLCRTNPNAKVKISRGGKDFYYENADENGQIIVGFDRDEDKSQIAVGDKTVEYFFTARDYDTSRIDGLPPSQVSTFTEAQLKRIRSSSARKKTGFASRAKEMGFKDGFDLPIKADFIKTTNFGAQRILNGEPKKPHYGVDLAAPVGTPIYAPADGIVSLADDDLYFEGAMVLLDHGQGLISMYLHTDEILVEPGQAVKQGEQIATVGSKGRSTGPHLCWRLKWRNRNLDPELLTEWPLQG